MSAKKGIIILVSLIVILFSGCDNDVSNKNISDNKNTTEESKKASADLKQSLEVVCDTSKSKSEDDYLKLGKLYKNYLENDNNEIEFKTKNIVILKKELEYKTSCAMILLNKSKSDAEEYAKKEILTEKIMYNNAVENNITISKSDIDNFIKQQIQAVQEYSDSEIGKIAKGAGMTVEKYFDLKKQDYIVLNTIKKYKMQLQQEYFLKKGYSDNEISEHYSEWEDEYNKIIDRLIKKEGIDL